MGKGRKPSKKGPLTFSMGGGRYKATGITGIVQKEVDVVEVRYGDGSNPLLLHGATVSGVVAAVDRAKGIRR